MDCRREQNKEYARSHSEVRATKSAAYYESHKEELREYQKEYRKKNAVALAAKKKARISTPEGERANANRHLKRTYGITIDDYDRMLEEQGGGCAICDRPDSGDKRMIRLHVDHCHETGIVRGLLCSDCNRALGQFRDDPERLERAAQYLRKVT